MPRPVRMLVEVPPMAEVSGFMGVSRERRGLPLCEKYAQGKYNNRTRAFRRRGYCVDTAGKHAQRSREDIKRQLEEDEAGGQVTMGNAEPR